MSSKNSYSLKVDKIKDGACYREISKTQVKIFLIFLFFLWSISDTVTSNRLSQITTQTVASLN